MIKKILPLFILLTLLLNSGAANGANVSISAKLDSVNILMGRINTLHLEGVENKGTKGRLNIFKPTDQGKGFAGVCGDSVELSTNYKVDTTELGSGKIQLNFSIPVQAFDSGTYTRPKFVYYAGKDSAVSNSLTFNVYPLNVTAEDQISPFANEFQPDGQRWYDWVPDWILDFWWIFLILVLAICIGLYSMRAFNKKGIPFIAPKPQPKPWEIALDSLQRLKSRKLWEQGMEKEYFTDLTDILRVYLYERFGINAMEMTSRQIMEKIHESDLRDKKDYVKQILSVADFVKFAKVRPLPADNIAAYENARRFVEETIPTEKPSTMEEESGEGGDHR